MALLPGLQGTVEAVVGAADTARALGSGDVDVLGTPRVLALVEAASLAAVAGRLGDGETTVGSRVELEHLAPTRVGSTVRASAELAEVAGRRLVFAVTLAEGERTVARGTVTRSVVARDRFGPQASTEERG